MIGILGGSFDPVHNGHLTVANYAYHTLALRELRFLPCGQHAFNKPFYASKKQRLIMLQLALKDKAHLSIDCQELDRKGPSYTIDTLQQIRSTIGRQTSLIWILGQDGLPSLSRWQNWDSLSDYCHLVIVKRHVPVRPLKAALTHLIKRCLTTSMRDLQLTPSGKIYFLNMPTSAISSTQIRTQLQQGTLQPRLLPPAVLNYIQTHRLYHCRS